MNTENQFTKGQEVWVKAIIVDKKEDFDWGIEISRRTISGSICGFTHPNEIRTTEQICAEVIKEEEERLKNIGIAPPSDGQNANDRTRPFRERDKVRVVERWGRPLKDQEDFEDWGFKLNEVYEVAEDEDCDNEVKLKNGEHYWCFPFYVLDLVEPAPEPKYWLHESPKTYSIYYKGQFGRVITAMLMQKDLYTLEEAQEQCDKLNQKD